MYITNQNGSDIHPNLQKGLERFPELQQWIRPVVGSKRKAYCLYCKCDMNAKLSDLRKHATSAKHVKASEPFSSARQKKATIC